MEHYFSKESQTASHPREISFRFREHNFIFTSDNAVFSKSQADRASLILIDEIINYFNENNIEEGNFLDFASGYGLIGVLIKYFFPKMNIYFSEINSRAVHLCKLNAQRVGIAERNVFESDGIAELKDMKFDFVSLNPPIRAGKEVVKRLLLESKDIIGSSSVFFTVIGKKQGADSYGKFLSSVYESERLNYKKGFEVRMNKLQLG